MFVMGCSFSSVYNHDVKFLALIDGPIISHSSHEKKMDEDVFKCSVGSGVFLQRKA